MRFLVLLSMKHNFFVRARHVPGVSSDIADALSHFQDERFRASAPKPQKKRVPSRQSRIQSRVPSSQSRILRQPVTPGFLQAIKPILQSWLGDHNFTMVRAAFFLAFFAFLRCNEFIYQGISRFRPRLTCPLTVCRYSPIWLPRRECLFFLRLPSPMPFAKGIRLLLHAPPHRFVR